LTECTWYGVTCNASRSRITGIALDRNNLTGTLPANLNALTNLTTFTVSVNQLTGAIPALAGISTLSTFAVDSNRLTGPLPQLSSLTNLAAFVASNNQLSGSIPPLAGLTKLANFNVRFNALTGTIPSLAGLTSLGGFNVSSNRLTGPMPSLAGLGKLQVFNVADNFLTGNVTPVPNPSVLLAGASRLCPNFLNPSQDPAWDTATAGDPAWYADCSYMPQVGLWWNPAESGTGYAFDFKHGVLVVTVYSYTGSGQPIWYLASGPVIDNTFTSTLDKYQNGQCIACAYRPATINGNDGTIRIFFTSPTSATMTLPGGRTFPVVPQDF
jgi:hypothetical protein